MLDDEFDLCIGDNGMIYDSMMQVNGSVVDLSGSQQRVLSKGLSLIRVNDVFWHPHALPNSNFLYFKTKYADNVSDAVFTIKAPSATTDSENRTQFVAVTVSNGGSAPAGTATAYVEFGYGEYGAPAKLYCTSRGEVCATGNTSSTINSAVPFAFEQTERSLIHPTACASSCSVTIPVFPQHVMMYRFVYLSSSNAVLGITGTYALAVN